MDKGLTNAVRCAILYAYNTQRLCNSMMTHQKFIAQCDDATLDYIEETLLPKLIEVDKLYKMQSKVAKLRHRIEEEIK